MKKVKCNCGKIEGECYCPAEEIQGIVRQLSTLCGCGKCECNKKVLNKKKA